MREVVWLITFRIWNESIRNKEKYFEANESYSTGQISRVSSISLDHYEKDLCHGIWKEKKQMMWAKLKITGNEGKIHWEWMFKISLNGKE